MTLARFLRAPERGFMPPLLEQGDKGGHAFGIGLERWRILTDRGFDDRHSIRRGWARARVRRRLRHTIAAYRRSRESRRNRRVYRATAFRHRCRNGSPPAHTWRRRR